MNLNVIGIEHLETVPMDLVSLSFWFSKNAILSRQRRRKLFLTNNVFERIILICKSLKVMCPHHSLFVIRYNFKLHTYYVQCYIFRTKR